MLGNKTPFLQQPLPHQQLFLKGGGAAECSQDDAVAKKS